MKAITSWMLALCVFVVSAPAADSASALRKRVGELEKENAALKSENERLRRLAGEPVAAPKPASATGPEVKKLEDDNRQLREQLARAQQPAPTAPPALTPGQTYPVDEFINLFNGNFPGAETALRGQAVRIRGTIDRMEKVFLSTTHKLNLRGSSPVRLVQGRVAFSGKYNPELTADGGTLHGTKPFGDRFVFARVGEEVVIEGKFGGMKENLLVLEDAKLVK